MRKLERDDYKVITLAPPTPVASVEATSAGDSEAAPVVAGSLHVPTSSEVATEHEGDDLPPAKRAKEAIEQCI
jgi:hypothetical protein